jgi:hypothetical protein
MFARHQPFARLKSIIACGMLVLYTGMMLGGESLHALLGCGLDRHAAKAVSRTASANSHANGPAVGNSARFAHDENSCPICQFHAQGQLAPSRASNPFGQAVCVFLPVQPALILSAATLGVYSPRGPPRV